MLENSDLQAFENMVVHTTWADEDFIGLISMVSRRTSVLTAPMNTLLRSLGAYRREWAQEFGRTYLQKQVNLRPGRR